MIEFIGLCVCSACLSCICCLITGGLCMVPAAVRYRNKIVEKHLPDDMQWLGRNPPSSEHCESDSSSSSSNSSSDFCPKDGKSRYYNSKISEESMRYCSRDCCCSRAAANIDKNKSSSMHHHRSTSDKKNTERIRSCGKPAAAAAPKRWKFCFNLGKSTRNSSDCCLPVKLETENSTHGETKPERKSSRHKKSKKSRSRNNYNGSKTYCAYFKSCSCTNFKEPSKKQRYNNKKNRRSETSSAKCPSESHRDKRRSKILRKSLKCPKNCQCKIIAENKNPPVYQSEREVEKFCNCSAEKSYNDNKRRGHYCNCK